MCLVCSILRDDTVRTAPNILRQALRHLPIITCDNKSTYSNSSPYVLITAILLRIPETMFHILSS